MDLPPPTSSATSYSVADESSFLINMLQGKTNIAPKSLLSKGALLSSNWHLLHICRQFWRIRHFRHIHQFRQNRCFPRGPSCLLICICHTFIGDFGEFAIFAIFVNFAKIVAFQGGPLGFSLAFATHFW